MDSGNLRGAGHSKRHQLADEVLDYLVRHPEAQDTVEGIAEWWLLERRVATVVAEVEAVLCDLVGRDLLVAKRSGDGRTYYRLNRGKERQVRRALRKSESAGAPKTRSKTPGRRRE
jgi:hypothetical protein